MVSYRGPAERKGAGTFVSVFLVGEEVGALCSHHPQCLKRQREECVLSCWGPEAVVPNRTRNTHLETAFFLCAMGIPTHIFSVLLVLDSFLVL